MRPRREHREASGEERAQDGKHQLAEHRVRL
jgi:hypothetical protein